MVAEQGAHEEEIEKRKEELRVLETLRESSVRSRAEDEQRFEEAAARAEECLTLAAKAQERRQELETLEKEREAASRDDAEHRRGDARLAAGLGVIRRSPTPRRLWASWRQCRMGQTCARQNRASRARC